jgi:tetratricopeptide (TPR) repeat protein
MLAESRATGARAAAGTEAWTLALRGWVELFNKPQTATTNRTAMADLDRAVSLDPGLALGWTGLAYATWRAAIYGWDAVARDDGLERAAALSRRAIGLDPSSADAHYVLAIALMRLQDLVGAEAAMRTCLALNPNHAPGHGNYGVIAIFLGRVEETIPACERALSLSPREPLRAIWHRNMAMAGLLLGDLDYARRAALASVGANAEYAYGQLLLAMAECAAGAPEAAREAVAKFRALLPAETIASMKDFHRGAHERFRTPYFALLDRLEPLGLPPR